MEQFFKSRSTVLTVSLTNRRFTHTLPNKQISRNFFKFPKVPAFISANWFVCKYTTSRRPAPKNRAPSNFSNRLAVNDKNRKFVKNSKFPASNSVTAFWPKFKCSSDVRSTNHSRSIVSSALLSRLRLRSAQRPANELARKFNSIFELRSSSRRWVRLEKAWSATFFLF